MDSCNWDIDYKQIQIDQLEKDLKKAEARVKELESRIKELEEEESNENGGRLWVHGDMKAEAALKAFEELHKKESMWGNDE